MGFLQVHIQCAREQGRGKHNIQVWFPDRESDSSRQDGLRNWRDPKQNKNVEPFVQKARKKCLFLSSLVPLSPLVMVFKISWLMSFEVKVLNY